MCLLIPDWLNTGELCQNTHLEQQHCQTSKVSLERLAESTGNAVIRIWRACFGRYIWENYLVGERGFEPPTSAY